MYWRAFPIFSVSWAAMIICMSNYHTSCHIHDRQSENIVDMKNGEHFGKVWRLVVGKKEGQCGIEIECVDARKWMSRFLKI